MVLGTQPALPMHLDGTVLPEAPAWARPGTAATDEAFLRASRVSLLHGEPAGEVYRNGQNSWSPTGWRRLTDPPLRVPGPVRRQTADDTRWDDVVRHHSSWVMAVSDGTQTVLLGALEGETPRLHADTDVLAAWTERGDDALWVLLRGPEADVFARYRDLLADRWGVLPTDPGAVWSSWYSYYEEISRAELDRIVPELPGLGFGTVQIDDGWQVRVGDWQPNAKFAAGMRDVAGSIVDRGLRPGLWIAPFIALPDAEVVQRHPELLLRGPDGQPVHAGSNWGSHYLTFDLTRQDARDHLAETVGRAVHDWGFTYLKLDFINAGAVDGRRSQDIGREAAYRLAIETVREAVGPDVYLLGSGAPVIPSLGVLNAVRTGPDVAPMWDNYATDDPSDATARNALTNAVHRLWLRGLIGLDPDAVYFRHRRSLLNDEQMQWLRDSATISGFRAVSDPPAWLAPEEQAELRAYLADEPAIEQVDRYRYRVGSRLVDFGAAVDGAAGHYPL
ncbi:MAG TPA: glycoside hydrolase family 36 protein [Cellulomonas sp.]